MELQRNAGEGHQLHSSHTLPLDAQPLSRLNPGTRGRRNPYGNLRILVTTCPTPPIVSYYLEDQDPYTYKLRESYRSSTPTDLNIRIHQGQS